MLYGCGRQRPSFRSSLAAEVEQHKGKTDCWIVYHDMVRAFIFELVFGWLHRVFVPNAVRLSVLREVFAAEADGVISLGVRPGTHRVNRPRSARGSPAESTPVRGARRDGLSLEAPGREALDPGAACAAAARTLCTS